MMKTKEIFLCTIDREDGELVTLSLAPVNFEGLLKLADVLDDAKISSFTPKYTARLIRRYLGVEDA